MITKYHKKQSGIIAMADHSVVPSRFPGKSASATSLDMLPQLNDDGQSHRISSTNNTLNDIKAYIQRTKQDLKGVRSIVCDNSYLPPSQGCDKIKHEDFAIHRNSRSRSIVYDDLGLPSSHRCDKTKHKCFSTHSNWGCGGGNSAVDKSYLNSSFQNSNLSCLDRTKMVYYDNKLDGASQRNSVNSLFTVNINNLGCPEEAQSCDETNIGYTIIVSNFSSRNKKKGIGAGTVLDNGRGLVFKNTQVNVDHKGTHMRRCIVGGYSAVYNRHTNNSFQNNNRTNMESFYDGVEKVGRESQRNSMSRKVIMDITDLSILGNLVMSDIIDISRLSRHTHRIINSSSDSIGTGPVLYNGRGLTSSHVYGNADHKFTHMRRYSVGGCKAVYNRHTNSSFQKNNHTKMESFDDGVNKVGRASQRNSACSKLIMEITDLSILGYSVMPDIIDIFRLSRHTHRIYNSSSGSCRRNTSSGPNINHRMDSLSIQVIVYDSYTKTPFQRSLGGVKI